MDLLNDFPPEKSPFEWVAIFPARDTETRNAVVEALRKHGIKAIFEFAIGYAELSVPKSEFQHALEILKAEPSISEKAVKWSVL